MRQQLESQRLTVSLAPAKGWMGEDGKLLRVVEAQNPQWYREFCAQYEANRTRPRYGRKPDTLIKRAHTLRALQEIENGECATRYAQRLYPFVEREAQRYIAQFEQSQRR